MKVRTWVAAGLAGALFVSSTACTHADFQYEPAAPEAKTLVDVPATLIAAGEAKDAAAISAVMDPEGRKSMILIAHDVAGQKTSVVRMIDVLALVVVVAMIFDGAFGDHPSEEGKQFEDMLAELKPAIEAKLAATLFGGKGSGAGSVVLPDLVAEMKEKPEVRRPKLAASFIQDLPKGCRPVGRIVSYSSSILDHIEWDWARESDTFAAWKERIRSMHLIRIDCTDKVGLWIMNAYEDGSMKLAVWHYFTPAEWAKLEPKIDKKLEIEDAP